MKENLRLAAFSEPELIQGGMGVGVSNWKLAREVAKAGEKLDKPILGVVSGVGLSTILVQRLAHGDQNTMRALQAFPVQDVSQELFDKYWRKPAKSSEFTLAPKPEVLVGGSKAGKDLITKLLVVANFTEVWLAKEGHTRPIGINYLEKVQVSHLPEIYGAMLADVDYVLMGAGLPIQVPGVLDRFADNKTASYKIDVSGAEKHEMTFDPATIVGENYHSLGRPKFLAVVSLHLAAQVIAQRSNGEVDGFVVESPIAGGHNAPPRSKEVDEKGRPIYGPKDEPDLDKIFKLGKPVWLAGGRSNRVSFAQAKIAGATGIQIGSAFALSDESGINTSIREELRKKGYEGNLEVMPSAKVSPTGFPFQVAQLDGSLSDADVYAKRERKCDYGFIAEAYQTSKGKIGFRCPAEPVTAYIAKGGQEEDTLDRVCLCTGLAATVDAAPGPYIVTLGNNLDFLHDLMKSPVDSYTAEDVIVHILS